ncbi:unnamed protein product, partial [Notodromas monacha]
MEKLNATCVVAVLVLFAWNFACVDAQYEDARCKCVCPDTAVLGPNFTHSNRTVYIKNVVTKE